MSSWKEIIVSGSQAELNTLVVDGFAPLKVSTMRSATPTASYDMVIIDPDNGGELRSVDSDDFIDSSVNPFTDPNDGNFPTIWKQSNLIRDRNLLVGHDYTDPANNSVKLGKISSSDFVVQEHWFVKIENSVSDTSDFVFQTNWLDYTGLEWFGVDSTNSTNDRFEYHGTELYITFINQHQGDVTIWFNNSQTYGANPIWEFAPLYQYILDRDTMATYKLTPKIISSGGSQEYMVLWNTYGQVLRRQ